MVAPSTAGTSSQGNFQAVNRSSRGSAATGWFQSAVGSPAVRASAMKLIFCVPSGRTFSRG